MKRIKLTLLLCGILFAFSCTDNGIQQDMDNLAASKEIGSPVQNVPNFDWTCKMLTSTVNFAYDTYAIGDDFIQGWSQQKIPGSNVLTPVEYNASGNPVKITRYEGGYDSTIYILSYTSSKLNKIVATGYGPYTGGADSRTTYDFTYTGTTISIKLTRGPVGSMFVRDVGLRILYYDTEGRLKEKKHYERALDTSPHHIMKYAYNAAGNMTNILYIIPDEGQKVIAEFHSYDNKKSVYGTHPVWQLLREQYSVNNPTFYTYRIAQGSSVRRYRINYTYTLLGYPVNVNTDKESYNFDTNQWVPTGSDEGSFGYACEEN
jgi:hypothetical protein